MLKNNVFHRIFMFLNRHIENMLHISSPQRNQIIIDFPKSTINFKTYEYCNKST